MRDEQISRSSTSRADCFMFLVAIWPMDGHAGPGGSKWVDVFGARRNHGLKSRGGLSGSIDSYLHDSIMTCQDVTF